ncbi:FadR/GntR family transcriptional regulator [uncultured Amnibacterium sp.]|uniref:FadR/GntR family transcriptional regulator n=1 Tax=uncultured Amnibacterium sp. TaxID=1631851 RepID=UPI0035CC34F5
MTGPSGVDAPSAAEAIFRPVRTGNAFEETLARLLQAVRLGIVPPGEALPPERELAARLGVSRDVLREAIKALADAGYLESRRGRYGGTFVRTDLEDAVSPAAARPPGELADVLGLRSVLEEGAVAAAASRALTAEEREGLWSRLLETSASGAPDYRRTDSRLHLTIGELAGVPSLLPLLADVRDRANALLDEIPLLEPNLAHSNAQHEAIVQAVLRGDPAAARRLMHEHLEGTAALLRAFLD